jgi:hypothetical protein
LTPKHRLFEVAMVLVRFSVVSLAPPGVVLAVSGSCASRGKWSCDAAVPLTGRLGATRRSTEPDFHSVELEIPEAESDLVGKKPSKKMIYVGLCWFIHSLY